MENDIKCKSYQWFRCFFRLHKYEILKEVEVCDARGRTVGINIISRCSNCGNIKIKYVFKEYIV